MDAADGAERRTILDGVIFTLEILVAVLLQRYARVPTLLRAPAHQTILTHVQVACARAALPVVGAAHCKIFLKAVVARHVEGRPAAGRNLLQHLTWSLLQRGELPLSIVNHANRDGKSQLP